MSQLSGFLKLEVSKYKDIDHILKKLEDDGEIQTIYDLFKNLFDNEFKFTLQELFRIQEAKKEPLNIKRQCENNLTLFKSNLTLIVDMIIDKALKTTLTENRNKIEEGLESTGYTDDTADPVTSTVSPMLKKKTDRKSRSKERKGVSNSQLLNTSLDTKGSIDKRLTFSHLSTSKIDSPLTQVLNATNTPKRAARENHTPSKEKSSKYVSDHYIALSAQASRASLHHPSDQLNVSARSFVQSEFNHISGSVKFSRSPRRRDNQDLSPGPGAYPVKSTLRNSPSPKIGKAAKVCWFDTIARNDSPGPYLYPSKHFCSK